MFDIRIFCFLVFVILSVAVTHAQDVHASAKVDSNNILIGDWLKLHVEVTHPSNIPVIWPTINDSLQGIEIVQRGEPHTQQSGANVTESIDFTVTSFDSGTVVIPPLAFQFSTPGDTTKRIAETSPIPIFVHTIAVDTSKAIRDIKPPMNVSISFRELLPYIIGLLLIGGLIYLYYYIKMKRLRGESILPEAPRRPAHEVALDALRALESEHLWQRDRFKEYHSQLTDILRQYIEHRFGVKALEMVTYEIMETPSIKTLARESRKKLHNTLELADYVKFAKLQPTPDENQNSMKLSIAFVEETWRKPVAEPTPQPTVEATA